MIKKIMGLFRKSSGDEEEGLYDAMIAALVAGIIIVIITLILLRPKPEYFTELYFADHTGLPESLEPGREYFTAVTIANHEGSDMNYSLRVIVIAENSSVSPYQQDVIVKKDEVMNFTVNYSLQDFMRAKVIFQLDNKNQEIHFFVYNGKAIIKTDKGLVYMDCLEHAIPVEESGSFTIRAKGTLGPNMSVRVNGTEIYRFTVDNTEFKDFALDTGIGDSTIDIVFDNDYYNATYHEDRNLYIEYVMVGKKKILPSEMIADFGKNELAFDCRELRNVTAGLNSNGALRIRTMVQ